MIYNLCMIALKNTNIVYTDVWVSMADEEETEKKGVDFANFKVKSGLMSIANEDAVFMHCLSAIRAEEVTYDVIDGLQSVVWDEA